MSIQQSAVASGRAGLFTTKPALRELGRDVEGCIEVLA